MSTFLERYKADLDQIVASKLAGTQQTGNSNLANAYALLKQYSGPAVGYEKDADVKANQSGFHKAVNAGKSGGLRLLDILSRGDYAAMNTIKEMSQPGPNDENIAEAFWKGLSGKEKTTGADVLKQNYPHMGNLERGITGFVGDVFLDPTTYVGAGAVKSIAKLGVKSAQAAGIKVGKKAAEEALKTTPEKAMADIATEGAAKVDSTTAKDLLDIVSPKVQSTPPEMPFNRVFVAGEDGVAKQAAPKALGTRLPFGDELKLQTYRQATEDAMAALDKIKVKKPRYAPGTKIEPLFKSVSKRVTQNIPAEVTATVAPTPVPVAAKAAEKAVKSSGMNATAARNNAFYKYLISNPNHPISVKFGDRVQQIPVSKLIKDAQASKDPETVKMIKTMLRQEAVRLAKLPADEFASEPMIRWGGRSGELGNTAIPVGHFEELLRTGKVGANASNAFYDAYHAAGNAAFDALPIHSVDDLKNFTLPNLSGKTESLAGYLKRKGVKTTKIDPATGAAVRPRAGAVTAVDDIINNPPSFTMPENAITQAPKMVKKVTTVTEFKKLTKKERDAWLASHVDILDAEDIATLQKVNISGSNSKAWTTAVNKILKKQTESGFKTVQDLLDAYKAGHVKEEDVKDLMKILNVKKPERIAIGMKNLLKRTEDLENKVGKARAAAQEDIWQTPAPVVEPIPVKPASEIVNDVVAKGDKTELVSEKATLDAKQVEDLQATIKHAVDEEILSPQDANKYGFQTRTGVKRTHGTVNVGRGRKLDEWNKYSQLTVIKGIMSRRSGEISKAIREAGLKGEAANQAYRNAMYDHAMPIMRTMDKILKESGIPPKLNDGNYFASLTDVLDSLPTDFVKKHFFDVSRSTRTSKTTGKTYTVATNEHIPPTIWNEIGEVMMDHARGLLTYDDALKGIGLELIRVRNTRSGVEVSAKGVINKYNKLLNNGRRADKADLDAENYLDGVAKTFLDGTQHLAQAVERNLAEVTLQNTNGAARISKETYDAFVELVTSPGFSGHDLLQVAKNRDALTESIARSAGITNKTAVDLARADVLVKTSGVIPPEVAAQANTAERVAKATKAGNEVAAGKATADNLDNVEASVKTLMDEEGIPLTDLGRVNEATFGYALIRAFGPHYKNADVRPWFLSRNSAGQTIARTFSAKLADITKRHAKDDINAAWNEIRMGTRADAATPVGAAQADLEQVVKTLFGGDEEFNIFTANRLTAEQVNKHFAKFGIPDKYAFDPNVSPLEAWKSWEADKPLDLLSKVQAAIQASITERQVGADLSRRFGSTTKKAGYVKIAPGKGSLLAEHLLDGYYFPRDIAQQMGELDKFMREMNKPRNANKLLGYYDTLIHSYKSGLTIYRPGHHVRNMVGDLTLSWLAGVNNPLVYKKALKIMVQNKGRYSDFDALRALSLGRESAPPESATARLLTTKIGGKSKDLTSAQVYEMAYKNGILPDYRTLEDIQFGGDKNFKMPRPLKGKLHNAAATLSESRDHYVRLAHFIDVLEKGKFSSLDEAAHVASSQVRKWHPDGSDLTRFESNVMRRGFLFYSWIRKAIPLVAESIVMNPGKVMVYPKAMYNMAEAMGLNPDTLGNPFPEDQLFPQWISDMVTGPQFRFDGNMWGINPGMPVADVLNDYATGPRDMLKTVLGSTTPVAKIPIELATADQGAVAKDVRTGAPQRDMSDYIDRQIPGINTLANITNRSPSSLFTQGTGESSGMSPQEIAKAHEKNNPGLDVPALLNMILGGGLINMTKPNYVKQAQIEQRRRN